MNTILQQFLEILTSPPGYLVYHIILISSLMAALQGVISTGPFNLRRRSLLGLCLLLAAQVVLFICSGLAWQNFISPHFFLPPLDRAFSCLSLLWITYLWAFPLPRRLADMFLGFLNLAILILLVFSLVNWSAQDLSVQFNLSLLDYGWQILSLFIIIAGLVILPLFHPQGWETGFAFMVINLVGVITHLLWSSSGGDFSVTIRLAQLCSYPLLPGLAHRMPVPVVAEAQPPEVHISAEKKLYSADSKAVYAWLLLAKQKEPSKVCTALARAIAQTMLADLCFLVSAPNQRGEVVIQGGYDLIREQDLPGTILDDKKIPVISNALVRGRPLRLGLNNTSTPDLITLGESLQLEQPGSLLVIPLVSSRQIWGGIFLLSPYSNRTWSADDQSYLLSSSEVIVQILQRTSTQVHGEIEAERVNSELQSTQILINQLHQENQNLRVEIEQLRQSSQPSSEVESLRVIQQEARETINQLQSENERLQSALGATALQEPQLNSRELEHLENELKLTLEEVARLQNALAESNIKLINLQQQISQSGFISGEDREVIASITQELRQPMASIVGYTDLLLSESVGILGALQRKFMERIKASIERMRSLLDDLIQVSSIQSGSMEIVPQQVDVSTVIDQTISDTSAQLREKKISLRLDLPEELPQLQTDRDALQQILVHLLQNAGSVTPVDGSITLRVHIEEEQNKSYLLFQVTDTGGGIAPEDLPRVFSRRYRADNPLIQGVGDSGVGLSIAKTLVEAQGGRIWVESDPGQTSTFSVLLPLRPKQPAPEVEKA